MKKLLLVSMFFAVAACKLQPDAEDLLNDMVVVTNYDESVQFDDFANYYMPMDSLGLVTNDGQVEWLENDYASMVTAAVRHNLSSTGRTLVDKFREPDMSVNVYVVKNLQVFQSVVYPYYYGYPGSGGYYGGYYNYPQVATFQSQTSIMVIELVDLVNIDPNTKQTRVIWTANIGDLTQSFDPERKVVEAIDQAFLQSEYLNR